MSEEPNRLRVMADECAEKVKKLTAEMKDAVDPVERKRLRDHRKLNRSMERWIRTRRGYE